MTGGEAIHGIVAAVADRRDFLDEIVDERSKRNPEFLELVQVALKGRELRRGHATAAQDRRHTRRTSAGSATDQPAEGRRLDADGLADS